MEKRSRGSHAIAVFLALAVASPLALGSCGGGDGPSGPGSTQDPPPPPPPPPPPGSDFDYDGSLIAFRLTTSTRQDIWLINLEQLQATNLTDHPGADSDPAWSPDGSRLAFVSQRAGNSDLYVINADGSGLVQVTNDQGTVRFPDWSPDGSMIAYSANVGGQRDLYVIAAPGSNPALHVSRSGIHAALAPADGPVQVTDHPDTDNEPVWTPPGDGFYFFSSRNDCSGIYHTTFDGTTVEGEPVRLSFDFAFDCTFTCAPGKGFSPLAGRHVITFVSDEDGEDDIWVAEIDPSDPTATLNHRNVSQSVYEDFYSTWAESPPSSRLAPDPTGFTASVANSQSRVFFDSDRSGRWQLWSVSEDGTDLKRLTNANSNHQMPRFRPAMESASALRAAPGDASLHGLADAIAGSITDFDAPTSEREAAVPGPLYDVGAGATLGGSSCERDAL